MTDKAIIIVAIFIVGIIFGMGIGRRQPFKDDSFNYLHGYKIDLPEEIIGLKDQYDGSKDTIIGYKNTKDKVIYISFK